MGCHVTASEHTIKRVHDLWILLPKSQLVDDVAHVDAQSLLWQLHGGATRPRHAHHVQPNMGSMYLC